MSTTVYLDVRSTPPRRRGAAATRAAILAAAKSAFASAGYAGTGLREIAGAAGVNAALVTRYFGSKDPAIRAICIAKLEEKFVRPLGRWIGGDDGEEHAARVLLLSGFFTYWRVLPLDQISAASDSATRRWMEDGLQSLIPHD